MLAALTAAFAVAAPVSDASTVTWSAPEGCPDREAVVGRIEAHLGTPLATPRPVVVSARGEVVAASAGYLLRLEVQTESGQRRREIAGGDCRELSNAAALLIAIAIDPGATAPVADAAPGQDTEAQSDPEPEPQPQPQPQPAPQPAPQPEPDSRPRRVSGALRVAGGLAVGPLPRAGPTLSIAGAVRANWFRAELALAHRLARETTSRTGAGAVAEIGSTAAELAACGVPSLRIVEFPLCLGMEAGALTGRSREVREPASGAGAWLAARAGGGVIVLPIDRVGLALDLDLVVPLSRPGFVVEGAGQLHQPAAVGFDGVLGLEVRLP